MPRPSEPADESHRQWERVRLRLREQLGEGAYRSWLSGVTFDRIAGGTVYLTVTSQFHKDWVTQHYLDRIRALWLDERQDVRRAIVAVADPAQPAMGDRGPGGGEGGEGDRHVSAPLDPRFTFGNFVVGKPNELA